MNYEEWYLQEIQFTKPLRTLCVIKHNCKQYSITLQVVTEGGSVTYDSGCKYCKQLVPNKLKIIKQLRNLNV